MLILKQEPKIAPALRDCYLRRRRSNHIRISRACSFLGLKIQCLLTRFSKQSFRRLGGKQRFECLSETKVVNKEICEKFTQHTLEHARYVATRIAVTFTLLPNPGGRWQSHAGQHTHTPICFMTFMFDLVKFTVYTTCVGERANERQFARRHTQSEYVVKYVVKVCAYVVKVCAYVVKYVVKVCARQSERAASHSMEC
jgi:hypothetical protein